MRVLFSTTGDAGHVLPLVPFARAALRAGHEVLVAAPRARGAVVEAAGLEWLPFDDPPEDAVVPVWDASFEPSPEEANALVIGAIFGRIKTRAALPGLLEIVDRRRPDVIVRETYEFASAIAAERRGIPHVRVGTGLASTDDWALSHAAAGLDEIPAAAIRASPVLSLNPLALETPGAPGPRWTRRFRDPGVTAQQALPDWWRGSHEPLVYVSFGSVAGALGFSYPALYRAAIDALAELPIRVLVTIGRAADPERLGPLPANVRVESWVPQAAVARHAAAMVVHGGYGSTLGALTHGVPLVVLPLFADQFRNARRVAEIGAGIALPELGSLRTTAAKAPAALAALGDAVRCLLELPGYRDCARRVAAAAAALPPVDAAVDVLAGPGLELAA